MKKSSDIETDTECTPDESAARELHSAWDALMADLARARE